MRYSKNAQMKIQQMAFMLVAVMIFFGMIAIVYFTIVVARLQDTVDDLREQEGKELARQMTGTPELIFSKNGQTEASTLDFDKALALAEHGAFEKGYWNLDFLMIERIYPAPDNDPSNRECNILNRDKCKYLVIIGELPSSSGGPDGTQTSPIAMARWDQNLNGGRGDFRFEIGRIHALVNDPNK